VLVTFALQLAVLYVPFLSDVFETTRLGWTDLGLCLLLSTVVFWAIAIFKWGRRRRP